MVDALANRVATGLEARRTAEIFLAGIRAASPINAEPEHDPLESPAVVKTISSDSGETLRTAWLEKQGRGHLAKMSTEEYLSQNTFRALKPTWMTSASACICQSS